MVRFVGVPSQLPLEGDVAAKTFLSLGFTLVA